MEPPPQWPVTNEVLASKLDSLTDEVRELRRELVRRDVYDAQRSADLSRITMLETQLSAQAGVRRQVGFALLAAGLSMVITIFTALIK